MASLKILLLVIFLHTGIFSFSQLKVDSLLDKIDHRKWASLTERKVDNLEKKLVSKSLKTLGRLQRQEEKLYRRMLKGKDSLQARTELAKSRSKYQELRNKIKNPSGTSSDKQYIPELDTLSTALKFADQRGMGTEVKQALSKTQSLQNKFGQAEEIKRFVRERRQQLKTQFENLGFVKQFRKYNKEIYYYAEQVKEYKEILKDSKKAEKKAIELLSKTKLFQDFMRKNSMLASLFRMPGDPNDPSVQFNLAGLQTRTQINDLIQQQVAADGPNALEQFRDNMQEAQGKLNELKNKVMQAGGSSSHDEIPEGFKPNRQKTKSFWNRLEYGANIQTQKATTYFPVTSDIGLSLGYKLNDKSVIGIGASYKMGMGRGWNHIRFTQQGMGLRSFMDWKIKGSFWISGGYEQNYKSAFNSISQLRDLNQWQQSGLIGLSKVVSLKTKFFKKTKLQLLWDFLSYQQVPKTQPVIFRIGYGLN